MTVAIPTGTHSLMADVFVPKHCRGVVVFAHGSGSSRRSPRNREVAADLQRAGFATVLMDLLTPGEARERAAVFDVDLLSRRLLGVLRWVRQQPELEGLPIGLFGASTGAAAALTAAAEPSADVAAVVARGGRPDLAPAALPGVRAAVLLVVGGADPLVLECNEQAAAHLRCEHEVLVVPGAGHLFEQPGALEAVARAAVRWFETHLRPVVVGGSP